MLRALLLILLVLHGMIHLMGFAKALNPDAVPQLKQNVSTLHGILWLISTLLFLIAAVVLFMRKEFWWAFALAAVLISQWMIILYWTDAKFGTLANFLILIAAMIGAAQWNFSGNFRADVKEVVDVKAVDVILTEQDIASLPEPVKRYIRYTGYLGRNKNRSFKAEFEGQIRSSESAGWMNFKASQYSLIDSPSRYFFIKASMKGIPVDGYHRFKNGKAIMDIRAASLVRVQFAAGREMDISETVTHFNDMCLLAPGSLISTNIRWEHVSDDTVRATYTNNGITVSAILQFNPRGELVNFISDNRYYTSPTKQMQKARWMTPVSGYIEENGIRHASYGEAIWALPGGNFTYAKMKINSITADPVK